MSFTAADITITAWEPIDEEYREEEHQATVRARAGLESDPDTITLVTTSPLLEQPEDGTKDHNAVLEALADVATGLTGGPA